MTVVSCIMLDERVDAEYASGAYFHPFNAMGGVSFNASSDKCVLKDTSFLVSLLI